MLYEYKKQIFDTVDHYLSRPPRSTSYINCLDRSFSNHAAVPKIVWVIKISRANRIYVQISGCGNKYLRESEMLC